MSLTYAYVQFYWYAFLTISFMVYVEFKRFRAHESFTLSLIKKYIYIYWFFIGQILRACAYYVYVFSSVLLKNQHFQTNIEYTQEVCIKFSVELSFLVKISEVWSEAHNFDVYFCMLKLGKIVHLNQINFWNRLTIAYQNLKLFRNFAGHISPMLAVVTAWTGFSNYGKSHAPRAKRALEIWPIRAHEFQLFLALHDLG